VREVAIRDAGDLADLVSEIERTGEPAHRFLFLAGAEKLSLHDTAYLELTERGRFPIATRDQALVEAATRRGLAVHDLR
jgi:hypothetical protein